jgi:hypothetical protein
MEDHLNAVIELLRTGLGLSYPEPFPAALDWSRVISIADYHHVLPTVAAGLRRGAADHPALRPVSLFVDELARAQLERNVIIARELAELVADLNATGVIPLILKGGAFVAERKFEPSEWRFMSDIDVLIRSSELEQAVSVLSQAGYKNKAEIYRPDEDNHLPVFSAPDRKTGVEIHTRLLARPTRLPLSTEEVFERADMIDAVSLRAFVPSNNDRLLHLIAHGAVEGHNFRRRHVILRECLDFYHLAHRVDLQGVEATFVEAGLSSEFFSSLAIMEFLLKRPHSVETRRYRGWVRHTLSALASPRTQVYWITLDTLRHVATLLSTRSGWRHLSGVVFNPARRRSFISNRLNYYLGRFR